MENLSIYRIAHIQALMAWNGMNYNDAKNLALEKNCEELNKITYADDSIKAAIEGIEKYLLNGEKINIDYLTGKDKAPEDYFINLGVHIKLLNTDSTIRSKIILILNEIHNNWVKNNAKKYNRDAEKNDKRLFQHLPTSLIGIEELAKDLMFLAPILDAMDIKTGEIEKKPWASFIPTKNIEKAYNQYVKEYFSKFNLNSKNIIKDIIDNYDALNNNTPLDIERKNYMLERQSLLTKQILEKLKLNEQTKEM